MRSMPGGQQAELLLPRCHLLVDLRGVGGDTRLKRVMLVQQIVEHEAVVVAQGERLAPPACSRHVW